MNETIAAWLRELDAIEAEARSIADRSSEAQFTWRPAPGTWSIGECFVIKLHRALREGSRRSQ